MATQDDFLSYLKNYKGRSVQLYCDIETFTCNKKEGRKHASKFHSQTYSLAIAYFNGSDFPEVAIFNNFIDFFNKVKEKKIRKTLSFDMVFHNGEKYDNHFFMFELHHYLDCEIKTKYNKSCNNDYNVDAVQVSTLSNEDKQGLILENRIKSSTNVSIEAYLHGRKIVLTDSYKKMNTSIKVLGNMLLNNHLITEEYLKTDFDYSAFDKEDDIQINDRLEYSKRCFESLNDKQLVYIRNDVIILALGVKHYKTLFYGFDFSKMTFTQNIKEQYSQTNKLAEFQLLKTDGRFNHLCLGDYNICGLNGFDYFRRFYKGGLNMYNDKYIGKIIEREGFSIDLNSSYPTVMYKEKLPTWLLSICDEPVKISFSSDYGDYMSFLTMTIENANKYIISRIKSKVIRNAIVKYYNPKDGLVYYNSVFLKLVEDFIGEPIGRIPVENFATFKCEYFGARDVIARNYFIKTQGKMKKKLNCEIDTINPLNIELTNQEKPDKYNFSDDMVAGSKVLLNGIYGVPALRLHFDAFHRVGENYINVKNGFTNKERNIVFSAGVTAFAVRNLLQPLTHLSPSEIDEYFWYADTDSLYMDKRALNKFPKSMFHKMNLGAWDIEHENISKFYAFNHKKYALYDNGIVVRCGGVSKSMIKEWIRNSCDDFEFFVSTYFTNGVRIGSIRSIRNDENTISIYESETELLAGGKYMVEYSRQAEEYLTNVANELRDTITTSDEVKYIETEWGNIGINDLNTYQVKEDASPIKELIGQYNYFSKKH